MFVGDASMGWPVLKWASPFQNGLPDMARNGPNEKLIHQMGRPVSKWADPF